MGLHSAALPDFPWDTLAPFKAKAEAHPDGMIDLSIGSPVDPTPDLIQDALTSNAPGYPPTAGTPELRKAIREHYRNVRRIRPPERDGILPTIGSKEMVALLPSLLGLSAGDAVICPTVAYPTYQVGTLLAGAHPLFADRAADLPPGTAARVRLIWLNSPSNPTGQVLPVENLRRCVTWARQRGIVVASDECYADLAWEEPWASEGVPSILDPKVNGGDHTGILALGSLSKRSNAAGYRMAWIAGDPKLIAPILHIRKHMGMMMPGPTQIAMAAALSDETHVIVQKKRYQARRQTLRTSLEQAGYVVDGSEAGLYLWVKADDGAGAWAIIDRLAGAGILAAPGTFYGDETHVRVALTASDAAIGAAADRLAAS
ncbi:MAG: succinyldiaminopimelate transaminase [Micrococcales bacterium]|nr:succinyldiaminopimelate transaminase [Micrococcales bacterium]